MPAYSIVISYPVSTINQFQTGNLVRSEICLPGFRAWFYLESYNFHSQGISVNIQELFIDEGQKA